MSKFAVATRNGSKPKEVEADGYNNYGGWVSFYDSATCEHEKSETVFSIREDYVISVELLD